MNIDASLFRCCFDLWPRDICILYPSFGTPKKRRNEFLSNSVLIALILMQPTLGCLLYVGILYFKYQTFVNLLFNFSFNLIL